MSATKNINAEKIQGNLTGMTSVSAISLSGGSLTITGTGMFNTLSATTYQNLPSSTFTGGTVTGETIFTNGLSATTISATTYQNLPTDVRVTGATYNNNTFTYTNNTGGTFNVLFNTMTGLTVNGNLTATTISATTYQNLPPSVDTFVTGFTYNNNTFTILRNQGQPNLTSTINTMTGLTVNGNLSVTGNTSLQGLTATTISATTYLGIPTSTFTGGTVTGATIFTNGLTATTISATTYQNLPSGVFAISNSAGTYTYYTTLTNAMAAATSGQTIEMFANYTESGAVTISWKDGVNFNGNGYTYTHNHSAGASNTISLDVVVTAIISNWRVIRSGRALGSTGDSVFYVTPLGFGTNASDIQFSNVYMESTYGTAVNFAGGSGNYQGTLYGKGYLYGIFAQATVRGMTGQSTAATPGIYIGALASIYNCTGISVSGYGIHNNGGNYLVDCVGISTSNVGLHGGSHFNCIGISTSGAGGFGSGYNSTYISTSGAGTDNLGGSNNWIYSSTNYGATGFFGFSMENSTIISNSNIAAHNAITLKNCSVTSNWNNAGGHAVAHRPVAGNNLLNCTLQVANTSARCITSAGAAITVKYASNVYIGSTVPVNTSLITQGITNTQDNQGNILI